MRIGRLLFGFAVLAIVCVALAGSVWLKLRLNTGAELAARSEAGALDDLEATLRTGPAPKDWPLRAFIPTSFLKAAVSAFDGSDLRLPAGQESKGRVDGFIHVKIMSAELLPDDASVGVRLKARVGYEPDRDHPWWADATADLDVEAEMLLNVGIEPDGTQRTRFQIVPKSIEIGGGWWFFRVRTLGLLASVAANEVMVRLNSQLNLSLPLPLPIEADLSIASSEFQGFGGGGGTNLSLSMPRAKQPLKDLSVPRWVATRSGIWLLGGLTVANTSKGTSSRTQNGLSRRAEIAKALAHFETKDGLFELALSGKTLTSSVDQLLKSSPLQIGLRTEKTSGVIIDATVLHNDKVFGNVGLQVKPLGDDFGTGSVEVKPNPSTWSTAGLAIATAVRAEAWINLDLHLATGVGGGIGNGIALHADGETSLGLAAKLLKKELPQGTAIVVQPVAPCAPIVVKAHPGAAPPLSGAWFVMSPLGVELDRELGGMKVKPVVLADGLPIVIPAPVAKDKDGKPVDRDPRKTVLTFHHPFWSLTLSADDVSMTDRELVLRSAPTFALRDEEETVREKQRRNSLFQALAEAAPHQDCKPLTGLKLLGGDITISDVFAEIQYVAESLKTQAEVAQSVLTALTDLDPANTKDNLVKASNSVASAATKDFQHSLDKVKSDAKAAIDFAKKQGEEQRKNPGRPPDPVGQAVYDGLNSILSDVRVKRNMRKIGELNSGLDLYQFRYIGGNKVFVGLLAQEVIQKMPHAVVKREDGLLCVDYEKVNADLAMHKATNAITVSWLKNFPKVEHGLPCFPDR